MKKIVQSIKKNRWFSFVFILLLILNKPCAFSNNSIINSSAANSIIMYFEGKIDQKIEIVMELNIHDDVVNGKYYYKKVQNEILVNGTISNGQISLMEYTVNGKNTGKFEGKLVGTEFKGIWKNVEKPGTNLTFLLVSKETPILNPKFEVFYNKITHTDFKQFIKGFAFTELPVSFVRLEDIGIDSLMIQKFIAPGYTIPPYGMETFGYSFAFFHPNFVGLVCSYHYFPGMMGIDNTEYTLYTFDYNGNKISDVLVGTNSSDSNMGVNELWTFTSECVLKSDYTIDVKLNTDRSKLLEDEPFFEGEETSESVEKKYTIKENGVIE